MAATKLVSFDRLSQYDGLIKTYIAEADAPAIKRISYDSSTRVVSFYRTATAPATGEDTPYTTVTLPSTSEFIPKLTVVAAGETGNHAGDFVVLDSNGALVGAGDTIAADKITITDAGSLITATDVEGALQEIASASAGGVASMRIWGHDDSAGQSDYAKVYKLYQGENDYVADRTDGKTNPTLKLTINVPKDKVLQDSSIVTITYNSADGKLYDGATDVTALIVGSGTATAADAGKYMKFIMQNVTDPMYVNLTDFIDIYTVESDATQIQLAIDSNNEISGSIVDGSVDADALASNAVTTAKILDGNVTKAKLAQGVQDSLDLADSAIQSDDMTAANVEYKAASGQDPAVSVEGALDDLYDQIGAGGSVSEQIADAIEDLDSSTSDIGVTATSGSVMNAITGFSFADGKVATYNYTTLGSAALQADTYFLKSADYEICADTDIAGLFSSGT